MHTSQKQLEANRKNAGKSTGPKTNKGKKKVSKNAVKHGLYSNDIIIKSKNFSESSEDYNELLESLFESLKPTDKLQEHLVTKIGNCIWRSERVIRAETSLLNSRMDKIDDDIKTASLLKLIKTRKNPEVDPNLTQAEIERATENGIGKRLIMTTDTGAYIHRMEMRLDRQMTRAFQMLRQLQKATHDSCSQRHSHPSRHSRPSRHSCESENPESRAPMHGVDSLRTLPTSGVGRNSCSSDSLSCPNHRQPGVGKSDQLKNSGGSEDRPTLQKTYGTKPFDHLKHINASNVDEIMKNDPTIVPWSELKATEERLRGNTD